MSLLTICCFLLAAEDDKNTVKDLPLDLYQNIDPVLIQTVPFGLDIPDDVKVTKTACGTRHSCVLLGKY